MSFPELSWVLKTRDKMLIFGATINLVSRLKLYLNLLCDDPDRVHPNRSWSKLGL